jgi:hypothetical protein
MELITKKIVGFSPETLELLGIRESRCGSCGRSMESDPTSKYFIAFPENACDSDYCGCVKGSGN